MRTDTNGSIVIRISADSGIKKTDNLHVFVTDNSGRIIEASSFDGLEARLKTPAPTLKGGAKIFIAPGLPKGTEASSFNERDLRKAGAYQVTKAFTDRTFIDVSRIPSGALKPWFWGNCLISGNITKDFFIDGQWKTLPVCNARVHICEVETELVLPHIPIYYRQIPDWIIQEISDKFREVIKVVPPFPPDPYRQSAASELARTQSSGKTAGREIARMQKMNVPLNSLRASEPLQESLRLQALPPLPEEVAMAMSSGSVSAVRSALYDYHDILYPYICLWPWIWPWIYTYDEETIVYTDCNGHFELWENTLLEDGPLNLYFWVEVNINGQWVTVYKPALPCHTYWNYDCGSVISIKITDPRVMPCNCDDQAVGEIVWFKSIGWNATALHIEQNDLNTVNVQGVNMRNVGCTDIIDAHRISPFGSRLNFRLLFGDGLPTNTITHYRWKKTRIKDENLNDILNPPTTVINGAVSKDYYVITQVAGHFHFETHSVTLGADGAGENIGYKIPHWDIYQEPLVPAADKALTIQWTSPDFWSASLDSHSLQDGLYRFDLELLHLDNNGVFQVVSVPKQVFQVSDYNNTGNSVDAPNYDLRLDGGNLNNALSLSFKVRIDNAPCVADIQDVLLTDGAGNLVYQNGQPVKSGKCGFIQYTNLAQGVRISYIASHPRNFATFSFSVIKGNNTESTGVAANGYVISGVDGFALSGGVFTQDVPIQQLLGTCPGQAALSENLYVAALATDGTYRLYNDGSEVYDASDVNAFAVSNV
ncbi:MAG: hypothetical protein JSS75_07940 [Bacteroidetes bacterium]|nr:hypothetical protein [Bacteroidota bacterium]